MQDNVDFDSLLFRQVANGKEFENLIPKSTCTKVASGIGDTSYSMQQIAEMVKQYSYQVEKVAQKLQTSSLKNTLENVKDFIYSHFQYKADLEDQLLRSPACSWHDRHTGIDCKSYSILASCILTELGLTHYIRRIKQPGYAPNDWTHVYVVVPFDQTSGNLNKEYYTIDGTLEYENEPSFTQKDDIKMSLQHYKLNAPAHWGMGSTPDQEPPDDAPTQTSSGDKQTIFDIIKKFSIRDVRKFLDQIKNLTCIRSAFKTKDRDRVNGIINNYFNDLIVKINNAVIDNDDQKFARAVNQFYAITDLCMTASKSKIDEGWNSCSTAAMKGVIEAYKFYHVVVGKALTVWLEDNFVKQETSSEVVTYNTKELISTHKFDILTWDRTASKPLTFFEPKPKAIPVFEISKYVQDAIGKDIASFNPLEFIASLSTALATFQSAGTNNPNNPSNPNNPNNPNNQVGSNATQTAGFGTIGWIILGVGATLFITGMKNNTKNNPKK